MFFSCLPYELRSQIWSLAVEPRLITRVHMKKSDGKFKKKQRIKGKDILYETTSTPPPAIKHVCHESRKHAPYKRAFTAGTEARWTWVNFDRDIFCVSSVYDIEKNISHRSEIRRLRIRSDNDRDWYESVTHFRRLDSLYTFLNLRDLQIVLKPGDPGWSWEWEDINVELSSAGSISSIDEGSGLVLTGPQLQLVYDWRRILSFDSEGNLPPKGELQEWIECTHGDTNYVSTHLTMAQMYDIS